MLDIGYEAINKEFGTGIAELVIGTTKLKPFAYNCAMEKPPTSTEQKFLVLLARIKEVPDMACHIIQAIAVLEELKISMASNQLMIRQETPKILTEKIALAQEAAALQTEVLARLGYNRLAAELVNAAGYHLDPQAYTKAKGNIETTIGMKLEKSKDCSKDKSTTMNSKDCCKDKSSAMNSKDCCKVKSIDKTEIKVEPETK